jgi:heat shock protein HslJ
MRRFIDPTGIPAWPVTMLLFGMLIEVMAQSIQGTAWNAVELYGDTVTRQSSTSDRQPYLVFGTNGQISGADGCNRLMGPYTVTTSDIAFGEIAGTQQLCPSAEKVAQRFRAALTQAAHWRMVMGRLEFYGAAGKPIAVFEQRTAPPNTPVTPPERTAAQLVKFQGSHNAP